MTFNQINFENEFDAIWACVSLIHLSKRKLKETLFKFSKALKDNGILYSSF